MSGNNVNYEEVATVKKVTVEQVREALIRARRIECERLAATVRDSVFLSAEQIIVDALAELRQVALDDGTGE